MSISISVNGLALIDKPYFSSAVVTAKKEMKENKLIEIYTKIRFT